uniref:Uncharacterized protein n=1 Tax=Glossina austeni TaxID=7395 RepID=A0A1A9UVZ6_GLOAU
MIYNDIWDTRALHVMACMRTCSTDSTCMTCFCMVMGMVLLARYDNEKNADSANATATAADNHDNDDDDDDDNDDDGDDDDDYRYDKSVQKTDTTAQPIWAKLRVQLSEMRKIHSNLH